MSANIVAIADMLKRSAVQDAEGLSSERREIAEVTREVATDLESVVFVTNCGIWQHKSTLSANDDLSSAEIAPEFLNRAAIRYFSQSVVNHAVIDWFYIDALVAYSNKKMVAVGEALVADQFAGALTHGIRMLLDGKYWMGILMISAKLLKLIFILVVIFFPLSIADDGHAVMSIISMGGVGYFLLSGHRAEQEYLAVKRKMFERIWSVNKVYAIIAENEEINWELLSRELSDARRQGVPLLSALDVAVNFRVK